MTAENFCYWLQGLLELEPDLDKLDKNQVKMIRDHLHYVFGTPTEEVKSYTPPATSITSGITVPFPQYTTSIWPKSWDGILGRQTVQLC